MADKKISQLTALSAANLAPSTDVLAIVDTSATETKKIVAQDLINGVLNVASAVGIGTASPAYKLDVRGSTDTSYFNITSTADANSTTLRIGTDATAAFINATGSSSGTLQLRTYGTTRATLDSSGNLGLGVTPSAWLSSYAPVFENRGGSVIAPSTTQLQLFSNAYLNSSVQWVRRNDGYAAYYNIGAGAHEWHIAGTNSAGSTISWTQAMTLDASGNLLVGGTSQSGTANREAVFSANKFGLAIIDTTAQTTGVGGALNLGGNYRSAGDAQAFVRIEAAKENATDANYAYAMAFSTTPNGGTFTERARITSGGDLLVATTDSAETTGPGLKLIGSTTIAKYRVVTDTATSGETTFVHYNTNATNNGYRFYVTAAGTINAITTTISAISDQRLKENVRDLDVGLDAVMALKPRKFDWKEGKGKDIKNDRGFIAQEFEQVFPDLIDEWKDPAPEGEEPYKSVRQDLIPVLVKAIQELTARVAALEAK